MTKKIYELNYSLLGDKLEKAVKNSKDQRTVCLGDMRISEPTYKTICDGNKPNITQKTFLRITNWMGENPCSFYRLVGGKEKPTVIDRIGDNIS